MQLRIKEVLLLLVSVAGTLLICLLILRAYAPQLLGIPIDLQMVQTSKEVPPFFDNVFRPEDFASTTFLIPDPVMLRAVPLFPDASVMGPNDLLGFRNRAIPTVADVIVIGDSQTYGNNAFMDKNWPNRFGQTLREGGRTLVKYDMAVGGWGGVEYLEAFRKAVYFKPKVVVVAFYTGNDALESFRVAYSKDRWRDLRPDPSLDASDGPHIEFPSPPEKHWPVTFGDGVNATFTPELRLTGNQEHRAVVAGYKIMGLAAKQISELAEEHAIKLYFTIIPTKELVYAAKVRAEKLDEPPEYSALIESELKNMEDLKAQLVGLANAVYVDVLEPLQAAALKSANLYPDDSNGHPVALGYKVIGDAVANKVTIDTTLPDGLFFISTGKDWFEIAIIHAGEYWTFAHEDWVEANGWPGGDYPTVAPRDLINVPRGGKIAHVNKEKFGPR